MQAPLPWQQILVIRLTGEECQAAPALVLVHVRLSGVRARQGQDAAFRAVLPEHAGHADAAPAHEAIYSEARMPCMSEQPPNILPGLQSWPRTACTCCCHCDGRAAAAGGPAAGQACPLRTGSPPGRHPCGVLAWAGRGSRPLVQPDHSCCCLPLLIPAVQEHQGHTVSADGWDRRAIR